MSGSVETAHLLECLRAVLAERRARLNRAGAGGTVIPIIVDERQRFTALLREVVRPEGGVLVDATKCGHGVDVTEDPAVKVPKLVAAVEVALDAINGFETDADLALVYETGRVSVTGRAAYDDANSANRAVRELVTAMFDETLRESELPSLIWADEHFDDRHASVLWPLVCSIQDLVARPTAVVLLVACEATLRPTLHCSGPISVRHVVSTSGLRTRTEWEAAVAAVRTQRNWVAADAPLFVFFLGAGASVVEGLATGNALRDEALAGLLGLPEVDETNFVDAAVRLYEELEPVTGRLSESERENGALEFARTLTLERLIKEEQFRENRDDSTTLRRFANDHTVAMGALRAAQQAGEFADDPLVKILGLQRRLILVTVNFDQVVETKAPGLVMPFSTVDELERFPTYLDQYASNGGAVPLLKLHGDIGKPETLVADTDKTVGGLSRSRLDPLEALLARFGAGNIRPWWWIGYSMRDLDLEDVWARTYFPDKVVERWVAPFIDDSVRAFHRRWRAERWRQGGRYSTEDRVVTITARDFYHLFFTEIASSW